MMVPVGATTVRAVSGVGLLSLRDLGCRFNVFVIFIPRGEADARAHGRLSILRDLKIWTKRGLTAGKSMTILGMSDVPRTVLITVRPAGQVLLL